MGAEPGDPAGPSPWGQECRGSLDLVDTARSDGLGIRPPKTQALIWLCKLPVTSCGRNGGQLVGTALQQRWALRLLASV